MKIKLLACFALVAILSSCAKEEEIVPKPLAKPINSVSTDSYKPLQSTNFNNSWPLAK